ncbi:DoxX family protein [Nannocystis bainbridge]|uniref:DoxX family protein n=1 Tax=Nannocystis bainbridge TaxID=2995303 RepID=A0ABT5E670_9BACT|nr:DoxX family protein [Nannocystis bainbridge]MDC0721357.1 DoxX family protein [Nannocystis bainbridge]
MTEPQASSPWPRRVGIALSVLPVAMLLFSASAKLGSNPEAVAGFKAMGYPDGALLKLGIIELVATILYAIPATAVLGAILVTGYLGGAVDVHVRGGDELGKILFPVILGVIAWAGLYLRDPRLRALLPIKR